MLLRTVNNLFLWAIYTMAMLNNQRVLYIGSILGGPRHWVHFRCGRVFIRLVGDVRVSVEKINLGMARSHQ